MNPMITTEAVFWTQIVSIVGFVGAVFYLYRLLVEQKESTIRKRLAVPS